MVNIFSFEDLLAYAQFHGYFLIFLIMIVEGPIMTVAAAFASSLGYFNIWLIFLLSAVADFVSDAVFYYLGYITRRRVMDRYLAKSNLSYFSKLEEKFKTHPGKTIFALKLSPFVILGLMVAGATRVPLKKYVYWNLVNNIPRTIFFVLVGYYFGVFAKSILEYYNEFTYYFFALIILIVIFYFGLKKFSGIFLNKKIKN